MPKEPRYFEHKKVRYFERVAELDEQDGTGIPNSDVGVPAVQAWVQREVNKYYVMKFTMYAAVATRARHG